MQRGHEVLYPAYRGCDGFGTELRDANCGECGAADVRNLIDCANHWRRRDGNDSRALAIMGFSYGGLLTYLSLAEPDARWTCAVTLWGCTAVPPGTRQCTSETLRQEPSIPKRLVTCAHNLPDLLMLRGERDAAARHEDLEAISRIICQRGGTANLRTFKGDTHKLPLSRPAMYRELFSFLDQHEPTSPA